MSKLLSCFLLFCIFGSSFAGDYITEKPDYIHACKISDPDLPKCSVIATQKLIRQIATDGIPGLSSLPPQDPSLLDSLEINDPAGNSAVHLNAKFANVKITGLKDIVVKESKINIKDYSLALKVLLPKLHIESDYKLDGNLLLIPITGEGHMNLNFENFKIIAKVPNRLYEKGDFTFFDPQSLQLEIGTDGFTSHFTNLFNGNKELEESTHAVFNKQWKDLFEAVRPSISMLIHDFLLNLYQKTFAYIPANFFAPDIPKSTEINQ